jgi:hypothetical protein
MSVCMLSVALQGSESCRKGKKLSSFGAFYNVLFILLFCEAVSDEEAS